MAYGFIPADQVKVGDVIIDPTTGLDDPVTVTDVEQFDPAGEWSMITVTGPRTIGCRPNGDGWPTPAGRSVDQ